MTDDRAARATLTSAANPRLRAAAALRDRRDRVRTGRLLVDAANPRLRAAAALRDRRDRVRTGRLLVDGGAIDATAFERAGSWWTGRARWRAPSTGE